jgi:hypothetical protein
MAKIGTVQIEIKPVLNEEALAAMVAQIQRAVADAVTRGLSTRPVPPPPTLLPNTLPPHTTWARQA